MVKIHPCILASCSTRLASTCLLYVLGLTVPLKATSQESWWFCSLITGWLLAAYARCSAPASRLLGAGIGAAREQGCQRLFPGACLKTPRLRTKRWGITAAFHPFFPPPKSFAAKKNVLASPLSAQGVFLQRPQAFHDKRAQEDPSARGGGGESSYVV